MAVSLPQIIQFPIQYLLCERDHKISWKCLDCNLLMCTACERNIYSKFDKTSRKHRPNINQRYWKYITRLQRLCRSSYDCCWIGGGYHKKEIRLITCHTHLQKVKCEGNKSKGCI